MSVDRRLEDHFKNVSRYHRTGDDLWVDMVHLQVRTEEGPAKSAGLRFLQQFEKEVESLEPG